MGKGGERGEVSFRVREREEKADDSHRRRERESRDAGPGNSSYRALSDLRDDGSLGLGRGGSLNRPKRQNG